MSIVHASRPIAPAARGVAAFSAVRIAAVGLALLVAACASANPPVEMTPFTETEASSIRVIVDNRNFTEARLYVLRRGARTSLGIVGGKSEQEFTVDWPLSEPIQIEINLLAGPTCVTPELRADPGDILELQIAAVFRESSFCRR